MLEDGFPDVLLICVSEKSIAGSQLEESRPWAAIAKAIADVVQVARGDTGKMTAAAVLRIASYFRLPARWTSWAIDPWRFSDAGARHAAGYRKSHSPVIEQDSWQSQPTTGRDQLRQHGG